ncbi:Transmembrane protein 194A, partial [Harpegnathos saltator]
MHLDINSEQYTLYYGETPNEIRQKYDQNNTSLTYFDDISILNRSKIKINPFKDTCIGVYLDSSNKSNESKYIMSITETSVDDVIITMMVTGILIFWYAQILSQKPEFYYVCGTLFGVIIFILILIYLAWKLMQKVNFTYLIAAGLMSIFLVNIQLENNQLITEQYGKYITYYILITSLISFAICYRFGPVTNPRTKRITQWFLQV